MADQKDMQKGFNSGYLIQKFKPELAKSIVTALKDRKDEYAIGMIAGMKEHQKEQVKSHHKNVKLFRPNIQKSPDKSKDQDLEKD